MANDIRVRMAPSPTGFLHIGTAQAAVFNFLFARANNGTFILRIEDTDIERSKKLFEDDITNGLRWVGVDWQEFYRQSDRKLIYKKYIQQLLDHKKAFWCYHTKEELEQERQNQLEVKGIPRHLCEFKEFDTTIKKHKKSYKFGIIRLAVDPLSNREVTFDDIIRGPISFNQSLLGDFSIAKDLNSPLYNMAVVVDDYEMNISHIIRGEDHISNTPKQILIQEALDFNTPKYAHLPLILAPDRSKLSKRHGATALTDYKKEGYLPEAIFNYLTLLGFTPPSNKEILTLDELTACFDLSKVHSSGAVFDIKKLQWMNSEYIKNIKDHELIRRIEPFILENWPNIETDYIQRALPLMRERMMHLSDVSDFKYFFDTPEYEYPLLIWKNNSKEETLECLKKIQELIKNDDIKDKKHLRELFEQLSKGLGDRGRVFWSFRVALSGAKSSPDPIDIAFLLGKEIILNRLIIAIKKLS